MPTEFKDSRVRGQYGNDGSANGVLRGRPDEGYAPATLPEQGGSRRSGKAHLKDGVVAFGASLLLFGVLERVYHLHLFPPMVVLWAAVSFPLVLALLGLSFLGGRRLVHAVSRRPVGIIVFCLGTAALSYVQFQANRIMMSIDTSIERTDDDGILLYRFHVIPDEWSDPIAVPEGYTSIRVFFHPKVIMRVNGVRQRGPTYAVKPGDTLSFSSGNDGPAAVAVRIFMRPATPDEQARPVYFSPFRHLAPTQ